MIAPVPAGRVYPRACGGTRPRRRGYPSCGGLSPRVRGNPIREGRAGRINRSIPARAGEPSGCRWPPPARSVYPRACGGTVPAVPTVKATRGLSPRVRGNHLVDLSGDAPWGSIPARAGEPLPIGKAGCIGWVYPRACGGTGIITLSEARTAGLSPRVRGNPMPWAHLGPHPGSIPARAGEPMIWLVSPARPVVYPRACGGTNYEPGGTFAARGLSPRVRGNPDDPRRADGRGGSIPARAGEPISKGAAQAVSEVYPRACGGTRYLPCYSFGYQGLSPRVRGNRKQDLPGRGREGSIPARAGEPRQW